MAETSGAALAGNCPAPLRRTQLLAFIIVGEATQSRVVSGLLLKIQDPRSIFGQNRLVSSQREIHVRGSKPRARYPPQ